jgi:hypothetical protein
LPCAERGISFLKKTSARYGRENSPTGKSFKEVEEIKFYFNALYSTPVFSYDHLLQSILELLPLADHKFC